ncbi:MBL fold metallo-hydrolase [Leptolyngbya sp. FACHB-261]|nr:MBL fold metallo-hydrolase [Leptolyngbya sp. FACHB-261]
MELACLPLAVGHADQGICLQVRLGPHRVLLDCGLRDLSLLDEVMADLVLVSHAHPDHARGVLALHQARPKLPIYASEVTTHLLPLNWSGADSEASRVGLCQALPWQTPVEVRPGLTVALLPAGHLPGAACILLNYDAGPQTYSVLYTGDFFLSNTRLVEGLPLENLRTLSPNVLILEGSYGTARHPHRRVQENQLAERVHQAINAGQSVLLPLPTLGPGQEVLMLLRSHHYFTGRELDIWVDGQVAEACDSYLAILSHLPASVQNFAQHQPLFWDERIKPRVRRVNSPQERSRLGCSPCVVLTDLYTDLGDYLPTAGQCEGPGQSWRVLLPQLPNGRADGREVGGRATIGQHNLPAGWEAWLQASRSGSGTTDTPISVETYLLGDHCDGSSTTQLIHNLRPQHVVFVHGSETYLSDLANLDELRNRYQIHTPNPGLLVELPIGESFYAATPAAQALPEVRYEGEVTELDELVSLDLPGEIKQDPRWRMFADTGLIEARWQGEELVLRGLTPRELLSASSETEPSPGSGRSCGSCRFFRGQRCWNPESPLSSFKVSPEGYCPAYEALEAWRVGE